MPWEIIGESVGGEVKYSHFWRAAEVAVAAMLAISHAYQCATTTEVKEGREGDSAVREQSQRSIVSAE